MSFSPFEHQLIQNLKKNELESVTLACSGGLDSVVLLSSINKIKSALRLDVKVLYIHHGVSNDSALLTQSVYRDEAMLFVRNMTEELGLEFCQERSDTYLKSEEDCRDFRVNVFKKYKNVLTAHHKDDFIETLVLRMIRGAGAQGLKKPFHEESLRPFLHLFNKVDLKKYAEDSNLSWVSDPTNSETNHLRNWVREHWLKDLDKKVGRSGFTESLLLISEAMSERDDTSLVSKVVFKSEKDGFISTADWLASDRFQKQSIIAHILLKIRKKGYTKGQIEEVVKQLDQNKKVTAFRSGKIAWDKSESKVLFRLDL